MNDINYDNQEQHIQRSILANENENQPEPIGKGIQEILDDHIVGLKSLGIYASIQPVNLGMERGIDVKLNTLYYHTGMFNDALLDKLEINFPNEALKDKFKECVLFDIHSSTVEEHGALVTPYEAYIAQNYTNDMDDLLRLSKEAENRLSGFACDACNDILDSIDFLEQEYKEEYQRPRYQLNIVTKIFNEEDPQYFNTKKEAQNFIQDTLMTILEKVGEAPSTFIDHDGLTFRECIKQMSYNLGTENLTTIELPQAKTIQRNEPIQRAANQNQDGISLTYIDYDHGAIIHDGKIPEAVIAEIKASTLDSNKELPYTINSSGNSISIEKEQLKSCLDASETLRAIVQAEASNFITLQRFILRGYAVNASSVELEKGIQKFLDHAKPKKIAKVVSGLLSDKASQVKKTMLELEKAGKEHVR